MADLFDNQPDAPPPDGAPRPLADRLRPRKLSEVVGQEKVLGPEGPLGVLGVHLRAFGPWLEIGQIGSGTETQPVRAHSWP